MDEVSTYARDRSAQLQSIVAVGPDGTCPPCGNAADGERGTLRRADGDAESSRHPARARATMKATASAMPTGSSTISGCRRANTRNTSSQNPWPTTSTPEKSSVT